MKSAFFVKIHVKVFYIRKKYGLQKKTFYRNKKVYIVLD